MPTPAEEGALGRRSTDADLAVLGERLNDQDRALARLEEMLNRVFKQTSATNGRVSALELQDAIRRDRETQTAALAATAVNAAKLAADKSSRRIMIAGVLTGASSSVIGYTFVLLVSGKL